MNLGKTKIKFLALFLALLNVLPSISSVSYAANSKPNTQTKQSVKNPQSKYGFVLKKSFTVDNHNISEYQHEKSGMWLVVEKNNNIDKKFEIMVRTPAENDKGINHIIEHCVLNGSDEYPCKNMLWELHQMSYNTFLNAATYPCYTTFPVASIDEDELFSLAKIYTSGIFHPLLLKDERIFKKEGIRFELDAERKLVPNGTVFNEMQGNNPDMLNSLLKAVFPDTQNKNISGGIPDKIMDLSYKEVCDTYKKYYHPSNMVAYMSGDINYERFMKFLDEEYLKNYDKINLDHVKYASQDSSKLPESKIANYYKQKTDKDMFNSNIVSLMDYSFYLKNGYDLDILNKIINNVNSARTKFVKDKGYQDIQSVIFNDFYDPTLLIGLCSEKEALVSNENVKKTLKEMFEKYPIKKSEIDSVLGNRDFNKKLDEKTNLYDSSLDSDNFIKSFIKFGDPCANAYFGSLENKDDVSKNPPTEKELNDLAKTAIIDSKKTNIIFKPSDNKNLSSTEVLKNKINSMQSKKDELTKNYKEQKEWAETPNTEKELIPIKKMFKNLSQIKTPKLTVPLESKNLNDIKCYNSQQDIGDFIAYKLAFNINNLTIEERKYLDLLCYALQNNDTKNYTREKLNNLKSSSCQVYGQIDVCDNSQQKPNAFMISDIILDKNQYDKSVELLNEQINNINFKDVSSIKKFLEMATISYDSIPKPIIEFYDVMGSVHPINIFMGANQTPEEKMNFYKNISSKLSDAKFVDSLADTLSKIKNKIFNTNSLCGIGICSSKENEKLSYDKLESILKVLSTESNGKYEEIDVASKNNKNIAFIDPSTSNNKVICMINSKELCDSPDFDVTCRIINDKFLAPQIREKSGAYGANINRLPNTNKIIFVSYCDPNIKSTIDIFKSVPDFIKNINISDSEIANISKSLLGDVFPTNKLDMFSVQSKNKICSDIDYYKKINANVGKIKSITTKKIKEHGETLEKAMSSMVIYVVSSDRKNLDEKMFSKIVE